MTIFPLSRRRPAGGSGGTIPPGTYATPQDVTDAIAEAAGDYATDTALSDLAGVVAGKQDAGDYATSGDLANALAGKQDAGDYASTTYVDDRVTALIGGAGAARDTLKEIGDELDANETAAAALVNAVAGKQDAGDYATNADLAALETAVAGKQDAGDYVTGAGLDNGLTGLAQSLQVLIGEKQEAGDYATNTALTDGLAGRQPLNARLTGLADNQPDIWQTEPFASAVPALVKQIRIVDGDLVLDGDGNPIFDEVLRYYEFGYIGESLLRLNDPAEARAIIGAAAVRESGFAGTGLFYANGRNGAITKAAGAAPAAIPLNDLRVPAGTPGFRVDDANPQWLEFISPDPNGVPGNREGGDVYFEPIPYVMEISGNFGAGTDLFDYIDFDIEYKINGAYQSGASPYIPMIRITNRFYGSFIVRRSGCRIRLKVGTMAAGNPAATCQNMQIDIYKS